MSIIFDEESIYEISKLYLSKFCNGRTDRWADGQRDARTSPKQYAPSTFTKLGHKYVIPHISTKLNKTKLCSSQNSDCILTYLLGETIQMNWPPPYTYTCQGISMRVVCMQGLYKKEWKLFTLQITQNRHPISVSDVKTMSVQSVVDVKMSKFNT